MERKSFGGMNCSIAQAVEIVGDRWSLLILRDAFRGVSRFDEFQQRLGIARNVLQQRLQSLTDHGVLVKTAYSEHPPRFDYHLTGKGRDAWPVLAALAQWGDKYAAPEGPPVVLEHLGCGPVSTVVPTCGTCGEPVGPDNTLSKAGPGATA